MGVLLLDIAGTVCLLLWGLRTVRCGVSDAFGPELRRWIAIGTRNRGAAFLSGLAATLALQSSTATAVMTASFAGQALLDTAMAQAVMLGANVGTALATFIFARGIEGLAPALLAAGFLLTTIGRGHRIRAGGRALLGIGLILLSLHWLGQVTAPMRGSPSVQLLLSMLGGEPLALLIIGAALAALASSSLAIVLLVASLDSAGLLPPGASLALMLGANLGGAIPPVLATAGQGPLAMRVSIGNLCVRGAGGLALLPFTDQVGQFLIGAGIPASSLSVDAHILFNCALATIVLPLLAPLSAAMARLLPKVERQVGGPRYLDPSTLDIPSLALACAARETLRIGNRITTMLECSLEALRSNDIQRCSRLAGLDDEVDQLHASVKIFLADLSKRELSEEDQLRSAEIMSYAINLEHVGDILDKSVRELTEKKIRHQLSFSTDGFAEIDTFYADTITNLRLAQSLFISRDRALARQLFQLKTEVRRVEERSMERHLARLREGRPESLQTSSLHLDLLRDLKRINAHIASIAGPILKRSGDLLESRLVAR